MRTCTKCGEQKDPSAFYAEGHQCKPCRYLQTTAWRRNNAERYRANNKAYYAAHAEKIKENTRQHRQQKKDLVNASNRAWRAKNAELNSSYTRAWRVANPDAARAFAALRRARLAAVRCDVFGPDEVRAHYAASGYPDACIYCEGPYEQDDHIVPVARGGAHVLENLAPACGRCNRSKSDKMLAEWLGFADRSVP